MINSIRTSDTCPPPSGNTLVTAAHQPVLTGTSASDVTNVAAGELLVALYYIETV